MIWSLTTQLFGTIMLRPYVFIFLLIYGIGCSLHFGFKRTLLFGIAGYLIAWLSELSSIHNGFPYGYYHYLENTKGKELWILGVPLMDSISYVFLAYASYSFSLLIISPLTRSKWILYVLETMKIRGSLYARILGAILFVYLDIIIDPVALKGDRWFLGQIYEYPGGGVYFGVPLSNFCGWFVTGFFMIYAFQKIDSWLHRTNVPDRYGYQYPWRYLVGPVLYSVVLVFNISVTFLIGEQMLGWVGIFIMLLPMMLVYAVVRIRLSPEGPLNKLDAHLRDFPGAAIGFAK
jgi:uncharacterized membrane protein